MVTGIVSGLSWPLAVVAIVVILRKPLSSLVGNASRLRYRNLEVEFRDQLKQVDRGTVKALSAPSDSETLIANRQVSIDLYRLAKDAPNVAVSEAWKEVEQSAMVLIHSRGESLDYNTDTPYKLIQEFLVQKNVIDEPSGRLFAQLRQMRNKAVHARGYEVTEDQAREYVDLAIQLRTYLDSQVEETT